MKREDRRKRKEEARLARAEALAKRMSRSIFPRCLIPTLSSPKRRPRRCRRGPNGRVPRRAQCPFRSRPRTLLRVAERSDKGTHRQQLSLFLLHWAQMHRAPKESPSPPSPLRAPAQLGEEPKRAIVDRILERKAAKTYHVPIDGSSTPTPTASTGSSTTRPAPAPGFSRKPLPSSASRPK